MSTPAQVIADIEEMLALDRYHHVTIISPPWLHEALVERFGERGQRYEFRSSPFVPDGSVILMRTHRLSTRPSFHMDMDPYSLRVKYGDPSRLLDFS